MCFLPRNTSSYGNTTSTICNPSIESSLPINNPVTTNPYDPSTISTIVFGIFMAVGTLCVAGNRCLSKWCRYLLSEAIILNLFYSTYAFSSVEQFLQHIHCWEPTAHRIDSVGCTQRQCCRSWRVQMKMFHKTQGIGNMVWHKVRGDGDRAMDVDGYKTHVCNQWNQRILNPPWSRVIIRGNPSNFPLWSECIVLRAVLVVLFPATPEGPGQPYLPLTTSFVSLFIKSLPMICPSPGTSSIAPFPRRVTPLPKLSDLSKRVGFR